MVENVTNESILDHSKAIQSKLSTMDDRIRNLETDMRSVKGHMASFLQAEVAQDGTIAAIQARLDRIERRLNIAD